MLGRYLFGMEVPEYGEYKAKLPFVGGGGGVSVVSVFFLFNRTVNIRSPWKRQCVHTLRDDFKMFEILEGKAAKFDCQS